MGARPNEYTPDLFALQQAQTAANRPNVVTPWGSSTWTQAPASSSNPWWGNGSPSNPQVPSGPPGQGGGAAGGGQWTNTQSLSPYQQQRFDLGAGLMGRVAGELQPLDTSSLTPWGTIPTGDEAARKAATDAAYSQATSRLDPQWAQKKSAFDSQMAAQGVHPGDAQYNDAYKNFSMGQNDAYNQANYSSIGAGQGIEESQFRMGSQAASQQDAQRQQQIAQQLQASGWTLGQINALMGGIQGAPGGQAPNSTATGGLEAGIAQQQQGNYNQQQGNAAINSAISGVSGTYANIVNSPYFSQMFSDEKMKDVTGTGEADLEEFLDASRGAEYTYKPEHRDIAGHGTYVSPMAQDLERTRLGRDMVFNTPHGKMVDYGRGFATFASALGHVNRKLNMVMGL